MQITKPQDGLIRLQAETIEENEVINAISDIMFSHPDMDEDVTNDHGCKVIDSSLGIALNYVTIPEQDLSWIPAEDRG